jgi:hypothetical protein
MVASRRLVLLDMNGTLLYREKHQLRPNSGRRPDIAPTECNPGVKHYYYIRPGAQDLVKMLIGCPNATVGFYTSMQGTNASPGVEFIAGKGWDRLKAKGKRKGKERKIYLFDRQYNKKDPSGSNSWDTMRDLPRVWQELEKWGVSDSFGPHNTIMLDDTWRKMRALPNNVMVVPEYEASTIMGDEDTSSVLSAAQSYLLQLLDTNVRKMA